MQRVRRRKLRVGSQADKTKQTQKPSRRRGSGDREARRKLKAWMEADRQANRRPVTQEEGRTRI